MRDTTEWTAKQFADEWMKPIICKLQEERRRLLICLQHTQGRVHEARKIMLERIDKALAALGVGK